MRAFRPASASGSSLSLSRCWSPMRSPACGSAPGRGSRPLAVAAVAVALLLLSGRLERSFRHARNMPTAPTASGARRDQHVVAGRSARWRRPCLVGLPLGILVPPRAGACGRAMLQVAQHRPDDPEHRAVRHPDGAARLSRRARAARCGARHPRHRRGAGLRGAVPLFPAAGRRQHGRSGWPGAAAVDRCGARHGPDRPPAPVPGRAAAGASRSS